ncbi:hypothetical protein SAMN05421869_136101 [Nonomuraea jiangxiensis]|uniref:Uncharacterized protein n=1 Tax=Nonomuraea jiangxiensis TaxID=633440 RepID=A0A1G9QQJ5_9ACTN|nr:hypothetical protein SAMN05421869_136101 [Nonomuraea jiangxiensis]
MRARSDGRLEEIRPVLADLGTHRAVFPQGIDDAEGDADSL